MVSHIDSSLYLRSKLFIYMKYDFNMREKP